MTLAIAGTLLGLVALGLFVARERLGLVASAGLLYAAIIVFVLFGFDPPAPRSVATLYIVVTTIAFAVYLSSGAESADAVSRALRSVLVDPGKRAVRGVLALAIPLAVASAVRVALMPATDPPPSVRSAHPAPPMTIALAARGDAPHTLDVLREANPYRGAREADPTRYAEAVARGRVVYYENCVFCHGDTLAADGQFAPMLYPRPASFVDVGILPMFVDGFFFWRIAKGGPGLPADGTPWDSAMPAWEGLLSEDEMWSVLTFLSHETGLEPRRREVYPGQEAKP